RRAGHGNSSHAVADRPLAGSDATRAGPQAVVGGTVAVVVHAVADLERSGVDGRVLIVAVDVRRIPVDIAVLAVVADAVAVAVGLIGVRDRRAVVADVTDAVVIRVGLRRVRIQRTVVIDVRQPVAVIVRGGDHAGRRVGARHRGPGGARVVRAERPLAAGAGVHPRNEVVVRGADRR